MWELKHPPNEHLHFTSWLVTWGACSSFFVEIEGLSSELFRFFLSWIGRNDNDIIYSWNWMSIHGIPSIPHVKFFIFSNFFYGFSRRIFPCLIECIPRDYNEQFTMKIDSASVLNYEYGFSLNCKYRFFKFTQLSI